MNTSDHPITPSFLDEDKALACVHCGLCLGSCPTYLETGNENDSPRGRIYLMRALQAGRLSMGENPVQHIDLCLGCRACEAACPSGVQYGALLETTREHIEKGHRRSLFQTILRRIIIEQIFPFPARLRWALRPAWLLRALRLERVMPKFVRESLALLPEQVRTVRLPEGSAAIEPKQGCVGLVSGCVMSVLFAETNAATVRLLNGAGYDVVAPADQVCCGALYAHSGQLERARAVARANIVAFERAGDLDAIIINAAGCGSTLKEYGHLLENDPAWVKRAEKFSGKVKDLTEWMEEKGERIGTREVSQPGPRVTYHEACHLAHAQRISSAPRSLIKAVAGTNFVELPESDVCCGSAGSYNLTEPAMAERLQRRKVENILRSGAEVVVTTNPGCLLQIQAGLKKAGANEVRVVHIADFLLERI